ncbi:MAG: Hsp20/alpha crystallin family protein [bacterium]
MAKLPVNVKPDETKRKLPESTMEQRPISPAVDIFKDRDRLVILIDMPGVPKDGIKVGIDNGIITISGQANIPQAGDTRYWEFSPCHYQRSFELSPDLDQEKIEADYKQGVLTIYMPKMEKAKPKEVKVNVK